jgi:RNA polymerase sigma factor (sigma-70 family)
MVIGRLGKVIRQLGGSLEQATDGQLLDRFLAGRDEGAFEALVRRHGPMVLGVCRRVLGDAHEAEDAFQATFLVLATRAATVSRHGSVGNWLFGVARRTALQARRAAMRRRAREARVMPRQPSDADPWDDLREALDLELGRLPDKYRAPVVLVDLEGRPRKEAARHLGLRESTLASRLATARQMLARRLSRHGLPLAGATLAVLLAGSAPAAVPASWVSSTVRGAALAAAGRAAGIAAPAAALMNEVLDAMLITKLKVVAAAVLAAVVFGAGGLVYRASGQPAAAEDKPPTDVDALRKENELLRLNVQVLLEKIHAQEAELRALREQVGAPAPAAGPTPARAPAAPTRAVRADVMRSQNNLKQIALAFHNYADTNRGVFPPAAICDAGGKPLLSWRVAILPWLEQDALYRAFHLDEPWDSEHNKKLLAQMPPQYALPGVRMKQAGVTPYQVFVGKEALFDGGRKPPFPASITDGTSNTILVAEAAEAVPWTRPEDVPFGEADPRTQIGGWYGDLVSFALCDGSVRTIDRKKISKETLRAAITPSGGEVLGPDW